MSGAERSGSGSRRAALGLRAKTGRAVAVVVAGTPRAPEVVKRIELALSSTAIPATLQPYHAVMDFPWPEAMVSVRPYEAKIQTLALKALAALVGEIAEAGFDLRAAGVVGAPDRDLAALGSSHIRAHAAEGVLFRRVLEAAAEECGLQRRSYPERDLEALAVTQLKLSKPALRTRLSQLGKGHGRPWRADEKLAAAAAWLVLGSGKTE